MRKGDSSTSWPYGSFNKRSRYYVKPIEPSPVLVTSPAEPLLIAKNQELIEKHNRQAHIKRYQVYGFRRKKKS